MQNKTIGLLADYITSEYVLAIADGIHHFCIEHDMQLIIFPVRNIACPAELYDYQYLAAAAHINPNNIDGLVFASGTQNDLGSGNLKSYIQSFAPIPVVSLGFDIPGIPSIIADCASGFSAVISHLIEKHGCRKIALMSADTASHDAAVRVETYRTVLRAHDIPVNETLILNGAFNYESAFAAMENYVEQYGSIDFDAIAALNDDMAYGCIDFCRQHGVSVPEDIIVTGFDDLTRSSFTTPTLTTVNQQLENQGYTAGRTLFRIFYGQTVEHLQTINTRALFRQSCRCIQADDRSANSLDSSGRRIPFTRLHYDKSIVEWFNKRHQLMTVVKYTTDTQINMDLRTFSLRFDDSLSRFDISGAAIVVYTKPIETDRFDFFRLPQEAKVLCAFDRENGYTYSPETDCSIFNPNDCMIPEHILSPSIHKSIVIPLFHGAVQYGYMVYRPGCFDMTIYEIMCKTLASILSSAWRYTDAEKQKEQLSETNMKLDYISRTDELTRILNRRGFMSLGQQTVDIAVSMQKKGLVIFGDMDGLKKINDTYGHEAGDRAIKAEAELLRSVFRDSDIVGRMGGDEFAVVSVGLTDTSFAKIHADLDARCRKWNEKSGEKFSLSISLGAAPFSESASNLDTIIKEADARQYQEKRRKKAERR